MQKINAVIKNGYLKPEHKLNLPDGEKISLIIFKEKELENIGWLKLSEKSFEFWNNEEDEVWNEL